jgi:hypothetical protein
MLTALTAMIALGAPAVASASPALPKPTGGFTRHAAVPSAGDSSQLATAPQLRSSLVITVAFKGGFTTPKSFPNHSENEIATQITNVLNPWLTDVSRGRFIGYKRGTTHQYVQIQPQADLCSDEWLNEVTNLANAAERAMGTNPGDYDAVVYYFSKLPKIDLCDWSGRADFPENGNRVILNGDITLRALAHEFGHHLGLGHAGSQSCKDSFGVPVPLFSPLLPTCQQLEYGNEYSAMGIFEPTPIRSYSSSQLMTLGWNPGAVVGITPGSPPVTRIISRLEDHVTGGTEALRLIDGFSDPVLWVEFRTPIHGVDNTGVLLVNAEEPSLAKPKPAERVAPFVLDMTPLDLDHVADLGLPVGQSWTDPAGLSPLGKFKITLNWADTHSASVTVQTVPSSTDPLPVVPDVIGDTVPQAASEIHLAGLVVGTVSSTIDCEDINTVLAQSPAHGVRLPLGGAVNLTRGVPRPGGCGIPQ